MKKLLITLIFAMSAFGSTKNWTGIDTCAIHGFTGTAIKYSKVFRLTDFEDMRLLVLVDDTSSSGFSGDSVDMNYGYQLGHKTMNDTGGFDTSWQQLVLLDSIKADSFGLGKTDTSSVDSTGTLFSSSNLGRADTLDVTGWASASTWFVPEWAVFVRFWVNGRGRNVTGSSVQTWLDFQRRLGTKVIRF